MESPTNQPKEIPYPEIINQNSEWLYRLGAFRAAIYLKLWEKVARGSDTA